MALTDLKHLFVLMLENRSYDHMLGALNLKGRDPQGNPISAVGLDPSATNSDSNGKKYSTGTGAPPTMPEDPPHEYDDVRLQLLGGNGPTDNYDTRPVENKGFVRSYERAAKKNTLGTIMQSFKEKDIPVLSQLARTFCVCDHWFSSLPGPTVPNRYFLVSGSSNGSPKSPSNFDIIRGQLGAQIEFKNGTIFTRMKENKIPFVIYAGDEFPLVQIVDGVGLDDVKDFNRDDFAADCNASDLPPFIFIEPAYGILSGYRSGNSQHPVGDIARGDRLVKDVYEGIRKSRCWPSSALIITYDEHGGFYDHVIPPAGVPAPGDVPNKYHFDFTQLGVRVPAVIVSPLIPPNTIDPTQYDHTTVLATLRARFPKLGWLTERDRLANDLGHLFTASPADDRSPKTLKPAAPIQPDLSPPPGPKSLALTAPITAGPVTHSDAAFLQIAAHIDHERKRAKPQDLAATLNQMRTRDDARRYLKAVAANLRAGGAVKKPQAATGKSKPAATKLKPPGNKTAKPSAKSAKPRIASKKKSGGR